MNPRYEIVLPAGGQAVPLAEKPISLGRGPANDIVLADDHVSWNHAQLWVEGGQAWVRDLGSRNGTFLNDERVVGSARLRGGDRLRLGAVLTLELQGAGELPSALRTRHVEDRQTGVRLLVRGDRFLIGSAAGCDLRIEGWPPRTATIVLHDNGEIWVGTEDGEWQVEVGEPFEVRGRGLRVVEDALDHAPTVEWGAARYPYGLVATPGAAGGPQAVVVDRAAGREALFTGNRGALLVVLARKLARDREAGVTASEEGWCTPDEVLIGVWGRGQKQANHLNVLVHRLRGQLAEEGFDPWFVEKRRGGVRLRVGEVVLQ